MVQEPTETEELEPDTVALESLGYIEFAEDSNAESGDGVVLHREDESVGGYFLVCAIPFATAVLIDSDGNELRRWSDPTGGTWTRARLLKNGDLAVVGRGTEKEGYVLQRRTWSNEVLWTQAMKAHHDFRELKNGELLSLSWRIAVLPRLNLGKLPEFGSHPKLRDDMLTRVSPEGVVLDSFSLGRCLARENERVEVSVPAAFDPEADGEPDFFHCNSIFVMEDPELAKKDAIYALGNVLVSSRYQNLLFIVDRTTEELVWHWTRPDIQWQHEASVLANGNILFFDNGREARGYSRLLELNPLTREIVWEFRASNPEDFFSQARGTVSELDRGVLLVANSDRGEAFQINRQGEELWRYRAPFYNEEGKRGVIRIQHYSAEFIEPFLME